ncbi:MAG: hypothetical protein IJ016_02410 [Elusimicrobiaceae bacterium]|nr:hypothetical protein [Elusimicrobiaceae bacterium]
MNQYPLSQIGNIKNPKIIILLANPGGDINNYKELPEYEMRNKYRDELMQFSIFRQYCTWWDELLKISDDYHINDSHICSLDYYPYHTKTSAYIPTKKHWDEYSLHRLQKNKALLSGFLKKKLPIFGYYWGHWLQETPELKTYPKFYQSKNGWKNSKRKEFRNFLDIYFHQ